MKKLRLESTDAFVVIDVQNDFCTGGSLEVPTGEDVIPVINRLGATFRHVILTQDWHPKNHISFASQHKNKKPFDTIEVSYGTQVLWPDHCVQGSSGADFYQTLNTNPAQMIVRKGSQQTMDSYSAFYENDKKTPTGLMGYLEEHAVKRVFFSGLATDVCVRDSAIDARNHNLESILVLDGCKGLNDATTSAAITVMKESGVRLVESSAIV